MKKRSKRKTKSITWLLSTVNQKPLYLLRSIDFSKPKPIIDLIHYDVSWLQIPECIVFHGSSSTWTGDFFCEAELVRDKYLYNKHLEEG